MCCFRRWKHQWYYVAELFKPSAVKAQQGRPAVIRPHQVHTTSVAYKQVESEVLANFDTSVDADYMEPVEPSWALRTSLFRYQKQGLAWMIEREAVRWFKVIPPSGKLLET
jgi:hypothetical protein